MATTSKRKVRPQVNSLADLPRMMTAVTEWAAKQPDVVFLSMRVGMMPAGSRQSFDVSLSVTRPNEPHSLSWHVTIRFDPAVEFDRNPGPYMRKLLNRHRKEAGEKLARFTEAMTAFSWKWRRQPK